MSWRTSLCAHGLNDVRDGVDDQVWSIELDEMPTALRDDKLSAARASRPVRIGGFATGIVFGQPDDELAQKHDEWGGGSGSAPRSTLRPSCRPSRMARAS